MADTIKKQIEEILADEEKLHSVAQDGFVAADSDGSGHLDKEEIRKCLEGMASDLGVDNPSEEQVDEAWKDLDASGDGKIDVEEFKKLVRALLEGIRDSL